MRTCQVPVGAEAGSANAEAVTAQSLVGDHDAAKFDAVGPFDHEGQRHIERRRALRIAHAAR